MSSADKKESEFHKRFATSSSKQYEGLSGSGDPSKLTSKPKASSTSGSVLTGSASVPEISRSSITVEAPLPFKGTGTPNGDEPSPEERADAEVYLREILAMEEFAPLSELISLVARPHPNMKATAFKTIGMVPRESPYALSNADWSTISGNLHDPEWVLYHGTQLSRLTAALSAGRLIRGQNAKSKGGHKINGVYASRSLFQSLGYAPVGKEPFHTVLLLKTSMSTGFGGTSGSSTWCQRVCLEEFTSIEYLLLVPTSEYCKACGVSSVEKCSFYSFHITSLAPYLAPIEVGGPPDDPQLFRSHRRLEKPDEFFAVFEKKYLINVEKEKDDKALLKLKKESRSKIRKARADIVCDMLDMDDTSKTADNSYKELQKLFINMEQGWGDEEGQTPRRTRTGNPRGSVVTVVPPYPGASMSSVSGAASAAASGAMSVGSEDLSMASDSPFSGGPRKSATITSSGSEKVLGPLVPIMTHSLSDIARMAAAGQIPGQQSRQQQSQAAGKGAPLPSVVLKPRAQSAQPVIKRPPAPPPLHVKEEKKEPPSYNASSLDLSATGSVTGQAASGSSGAGDARGSKRAPQTSPGYTPGASGPVWGTPRPRREEAKEEQQESKVEPKHSKLPRPPSPPKREVSHVEPIQDDTVGEQAEMTPFERRLLQTRKFDSTGAVVVDTRGYGRQGGGIRTVVKAGYVTKSGAIVGAEHQPPLIRPSEASSSAAASAEPVTSSAAASSSAADTSDAEPKYGPAVIHARARERNAVLAAQFRSSRVAAGVPAPPPPPARGKASGVQSENVEVTTTAKKSGAKAQPPRPPSPPQRKEKRRSQYHSV